MSRHTCSMFGGYLIGCAQGSVWVPLDSSIAPKAKVKAAPKAKVLGKPKVKAAPKDKDLGKGKAQGKAKAKAQGSAQGKAKAKAKGAALDNDHGFGSGGCASLQPGKPMGQLGVQTVKDHLQGLQKTGKPAPWLTLRA